MDLLEAVMEDIDDMIFDLRFALRSASIQFFSIFLAHIAAPFDSHSHFERFSLRCKCR